MPFVIILVFGWRYPLLGYFIPLCMLSGIVIGLRGGRKWCDWYCPRGSFYDVIASLFSPKRRIPDLFRNIPFRIAVLVLLMLAMGINLYLRWPDPRRIGMLFVTLLTVTTALGIILAALIHQRAWCLICPVGTIINLTGGKRHPLRIDSALCTECWLCGEICPIQISPYKFKKTAKEIVRDKDCLKCGLCISVCPKASLSRE